jgi:membrane associated rhomboid family serine protease
MWLGPDDAWDRLAVVLSLIPIRDDNPTTRRAWLTLTLIGLNAAAFLLWQPTFASGQEAEGEQILFFYCNAEIPWEVTHQENLAQGGAEAVAAINAEPIGIPGQALQDALQGEFADVEGCPDKSWFVSVFVAMFLHGGWLHIAGNMLFLWVFGNNVEDRMGRLIYLPFYLAGGVAAAAAQIVTSPDSAIPNLGASGAVAAVLGAYLVMFPRHRVLSLVPIFFFLQLIELPAIVVLGFWFVLQLFNGVGSISSEVAGGVAYWAHIGGFVLGVVVALMFYRPQRRPQPADWPPPW